MSIKKIIGSSSIVLMLIFGSSINAVADTTAVKGPDGKCYAGTREVICLKPPIRRIPTWSLPQFDLKYRIYIPGMAYQINDEVARKNYSISGTGALLEDNVLEVSANGTYSWRYDKTIHQGRWSQGDNSTTLIVHGGYENRDWNVSVKTPFEQTEQTLIMWGDGKQLAGKLMR